MAATVGHPLNLRSLDFGPLATLTLGMLGLGGLACGGAGEGGSIGCPKD